MPSEKVHHIKVLSHSGYRGEERPTSFEYEGTTLNVEKIVERWVEGSVVSGGGEKRCFRVKTDDGLIYCLLYDSDMDRWFLKESTS